VTAGFDEETTGFAIIHFYILLPVYQAGGEQEFQYNIKLPCNQPVRKPHNKVRHL
jgi:hypothetical protein